MIAIVYKKQQHRLNHRQTKRDVPWDTPPVYLGNPVFDKPDSSAQVIGEIQENHTYHVNYQSTGFDGATQYLNITLYPPGYDAQSLGEGPFPIMGYIIDHRP